jgi:replicative DNA helicase
MSNLTNRQEAAGRVTPLWRPLSATVSEAVEEARLRHDYDELAGLRTGIDALDAAMTELLWPGRLLVVAGESGRGKTTFLQQLIVSFGAQANVLALTLEDDARDTDFRKLANVSGHSVGDLRTGFRGRELPDDLDQAAAYLSGLRVDQIDGGNLTVEQIGAQVVAWSREVRAGSTDPDGERFVVVIDQLSHIVPSTNRDFYEQQGLPIPPHPAAGDHKLYEWQVDMLRRLAQRHGVLIVLAHQLNEAHGEGKPTMKSIRGSRGIVHKADGVLIAHRPAVIPNPDSMFDAQAPKTVEAPEDYALLIGAKMRSVGAFEIEVAWDGARQRFVDAERKADRAYREPPKPSERAVEGMAKLAALRARFEATKRTELEERQRVALPASVQPVPAVDAGPSRFELDEIPPPPEPEG